MARTRTGIRRTELPRRMGRQRASEVGAEIAVTEVPGRPAERDMRRADSGPSVGKREFAERSLVQPARSLSLESRAARFTSRCRTTMLSPWRPRTMAAHVADMAELRRFGRWGTAASG